MAPVIYSEIIFSDGSILYRCAKLFQAIELYIDSVINLSVSFWHKADVQNNFDCANNSVPEKNEQAVKPNSLN